jgi:hypothetical protein
MINIGAVFQFEAPNGWSHFQDGSHHVFHGLNQEELIVSASLIQGIGTAGELKALQERLFQNAEQSVTKAAAHPALTVTQPLRKESVGSGLECWILKARTHQGDALFYQTFFRDPRGVLLATLEAPHTAQSEDTFKEFIRSVGVVSAAGPAGRN